MKALRNWMGMLALSCLAGTAVAAYPDKPVKIVVPYAAGGSSDVIARALSDQLAAELGQPVVVENRAGAGSMIGTAFVAGERPDGHTLLLADVPFTIVPALYADRIKYDPRTGFAPVALLGVSPMYLFTNPQSPLASVADVIAAAKASPGKVTIGSGGNGSLTHLMAELFMIQAEVRLTHIPYKGASASATDLAGGQIEASFTTMPTAAALFQAGRLRALAVSSPQRHPGTPEVPTFQQLGLPGLTVQNWWGILAPAGTPADAMTKLEAALDKVLKSPRTAQRFDTVGVALPSATGAQALRTMVEADLTRWKEVVERAGVKVQ